MDATAIDFWFDFASPYAFFAAREVDALAARHGRTVNWRPILLGPVFERTGVRPLTLSPIKGDYARHDWARMARARGLEFTMPDPHPFPTLAPARAFWWLVERDPGQARALARAVFDALFLEARPAQNADVVLAIAAGLDIDPVALADGMAEATTKDRLRYETEDAIARGVCGAPFFMVDGEPFFGADRMAQMEAWLRAPW